VINTELQLADLQSLENGINRISKLAKSGDKEEIARVKYLEALQAHIDEGQPARTFTTPDDYFETLRSLHLLTMKPVLYIANVDEEGFEDNPHLDTVRRLAKTEDAELVVICNKLEAEIAELDDEERAEFLGDLGMEAPGLDRVIRAGYKLLGLQTYFTAGPKEARAWTVRNGVSAPQAAGVIHTDFEKGFIKAEVIGYEDYVKYDGESGAKGAGRLRLEGKEYIVQDGDVVHFRFNV
jgi:GTP-binding protein YchF